MDSNATTKFVTNLCLSYTPSGVASGGQSYSIKSKKHSEPPRKSVSTKLISSGPSRHHDLNSLGDEQRLHAVRTPLR